MEAAVKFGGALVPRVVLANLIAADLDAQTLTLAGEENLTENRTTTSTW